MAAVAALRVGRGGDVNASRDRRLARLEQERRPAAKVFHVRRNAPTETTKAAIARTFPHGLPADARLVICSWQVAGSLENPISEA
jgi:hypothetical protein